MGPVYAYLCQAHILYDRSFPKKSMTFELSFMYSSIKRIGRLDQHEHKVVRLALSLGPTIPNLMEIYSGNADILWDCLDFLCICVCVCVFFTVRCQL
jgi:hypothetical protein